MRPKFSKIIIRLDKIVGNCTKHGWGERCIKSPMVCTDWSKCLYICQCACRSWCEVDQLYNS
ncbi:hypothetical protein Hanom_Chr11g01053881 [Helianthus anomalus]